jgi:phage-related protein
LHCFKKKSKSGIKTPKEDIDLIKQRLRLARELSKKKEAISWRIQKQHP